MSGDLASQVEVSIREMIVRGALQPGEMLTERELAARLHVSVTPVNRALLRLESEGLVRSFPKRGAQVAQLSPEDVADLREFRILIERYALERIGSFPPPRREVVVAELHSCLADTSPEMGSDEFVKHDAAFHETLVGAIDNPAIFDAYVILRTRLQILRLRKVQRDPDLIRQWLSEHQDVVQALADGHMDTAYEALLEHIQSATRF